MRNPETVGLELSTLARLDRKLGVCERHAVIREDQFRRKIPPDMARLVEPGDLARPEEGVRDRERRSPEREERREAKDVIRGCVECLPDAALDACAPLIEHLDGDVGPARRGEESREPAGAVVKLRLRDERATTANPDDLPIVLEDSERLAHDHAAHAERPCQVGLRRESVPGPPHARLDLLLQELLELVVQWDKASAIKLPIENRGIGRSHKGEYKEEAACTVAPR